MSEILLIPASVVKGLAPIDSNTDNTEIERAILDAQLLDFEPIVGREKHNALQASYESEEAMSDIDIELLRESKYYIVNSAIVYLLDNTMVKISESGASTGSGDDFNQVSIKDIQIIKSQFRAKKAAFLIRLQEFLEANPDIYPLVDSDGSILDGVDDEIECGIQFY